MKLIHIMSKDAQRELHCPRIHINIGKYCYDSCGIYECPLKKFTYPDAINKFLNWLYRKNILSVSKVSGRFSGTKYCVHSLDTVKTCDNCIYADGYDDDCNGLCSNENYANMSPGELRRDIDNGMWYHCRYWEPNSEYTSKRSYDGGCIW